MTKVLTPTKRQRDNTKNATKNFDYTTIVDRLLTVSWSDDSTQLVWWNRFTGYKHSHSPQKLRNQKDTHNPPYKDLGPTANQNSISKMYKDIHKRRPYSARLEQSSGPGTEGVPNNN